LCKQKPWLGTSLGCGGTRGVAPAGACQRLWRLIANQGFVRCVEGRSNRGTALFMVVAFQLPEMPTVPMFQINIIMIIDNSNCNNFTPGQASC